MTNPSTPTKKKGDEVNAIAESINTRWGLEIPVKKTTFTPSKLDNTKFEDNIFSSIKYLYWEDREALDRCLNAFTDYATIREAERQGVETSLLRTRSIQASARTQILDASVKTLTEKLFQLLRDAKEVVIQKKMNKINVKSVKKEGATPQRMPPVNSTGSHNTRPRLQGRGAANSPDTSTDEESYHTAPTSPAFTNMPEANSRQKRDNGNAVQTRLAFGAELSAATTPQSTFTTNTATASALTTPNTSFSSDLPISRQTSFTSIGNVPEEVEERKAKRLRGERQVATALPQDDLKRTSKTSKASFPLPAAARLPAEVEYPQLRSAVQVYLDTYLKDLSPFGKDFSSISFMKSYEIARIALHTGLEPMYMLAQVRDELDYGKLWSTLQAYVTKKKCAMPEKSELAAWNSPDFKGVSLGGELSFVEEKNLPLFALRLKPLKLDASHRFARSFGADRFLAIDFPGLTSIDLPQHLRTNAAEVRDGIISWLISSHHAFLGRKWRAFFVKPLDRKLKAGGFRASDTRYRVFFFATEGEGFVESGGMIRSVDVKGGPPCRMTIHELVNWHMSASANLDQAVLKFFSRLALGLSTTVPTIEFRPSEIIRTYDALARNPVERRLNIVRHKDKGKGQEKTTIKSKLAASAVMNDGVGQISKASVLAIAERNRLDRIPSVVQGRIRGAKGLWHLDAFDQSFSTDTRGFWIEVTDSQEKFRPHDRDHMFPDKARVTFDLLAWSKPLVPASLNFQLLPILINRGVPRSVIEKLLHDDLTSKVETLKAAMETPLNLRKWSEDCNPVREERLRAKTIQMTGGLPDSLGEKINFLVEHGFQPKVCRFLNDLCYKAITNYCERLESRMNIEIGQSTYAFMIADPLAILEENEIHLGFSNSFSDNISGFNDTMLNDLDVLVGRLPAHLPSDIQRVRAVFRPELARYKDVVVFSSKPRSATGKSLADELSGGDYDGDKAWICWAGDLVAPFVNASVPDLPDPEYFGMRKDATKVSEIVSDVNYIEKFLEMGFHFNLQRSLLGQCSFYHERWCYQKGRSISDTASQEIACLLGYLVDSAKAGLVYTEEDWQDFLRSKGLPLHPPKPAYKDQTLERTDHIIDVLVFDIAKGVKRKALQDFRERFTNTVAWADTDLTAIWKAEEEDKAFEKVAQDLRTKLDEIRDIWDNSDFGKPKNGLSGTKVDFSALVNRLRAKFLAIQPPPAKDNEYYMLKRWRKETTIPTFGTSWLHLKTSGLYYRNQQGSFAWYVAGKELGELKARASNGGGTSITNEMHLALKVDATYFRRINGGLNSIEDGPAASDDEFEGIDDDDFCELADF